MGILKSRFRISYLLLAAIAAITFACSQNTPDTIISSKLSLENCRIVKHDMGETCVPMNPQRIVALSPEDNIDPLAALGIKPVGYTSYVMRRDKRGGLFGASWNDILGAKYVGTPYQPSLEKILMLKPDLILSHSRPPEYQLLSAIAPTVPVPDLRDPLTNQVSFKEIFRYTAKMLDREEKAEKVLSQYQQRVNQLKERLGDRLQQLEVAVIFYGEDIIYTTNDRAKILPLVVFDDIGLRYKSLPIDGNNSEPPISIETIDEYDADVLFIVDNAESPSSFYLQHPLVGSLNVVKNHRAYVVDPETWSAQGITGANKILDDLFKYLPKGT
ncbi:MAG: putative siderophore-binding lipoprotein YfiY [Chroococcidiopsis sp. SAG 2025]|uniref:ABC transporter substrate-binding protein n=1 Tax=Chroococcidiopsis sp. SAG 2025 TaxID=171389 RepID=UPI002936E8E6|nr:iron-siderophore ABC transporter substrate-binding protein [Chroococcidiopsis sp. SAG 2025]MDV2994681.1 putative siderophore-binding lipoprotein YfiY [Chroococcidiopsis sp. SAG 2025]